MQHFETVRLSNSMCFPRRHLPPLFALGTPFEGSPKLLEIQYGSGLPCRAPWIADSGSQGGCGCPFCTPLVYQGLAFSPSCAHKSVPKGRLSRNFRGFLERGIYHFTPLVAFDVCFLLFGSRLNHMGMSGVERFLDLERGRGGRSNFVSPNSCPNP